MEHAVDRRAGPAGRNGRGFADRFAASPYANPGTDRGLRAQTDCDGIGIKPRASLAYRPHGAVFQRADRRNPRKILRMMNDGSIKSIKEGDLLLIQELGKKYITSSLAYRKSLYALITKDGIECRQIINHDIPSRIIRCHSWNDTYPDYDINLDDVIAIFVVRKLLERTF